MHHTPCAVPPFTGEVQLTVFFRKRHPQTLQPTDGVGRAGHRGAGGINVAQTGTGHMGVALVVFQAVALSQHSGNATLGPVARAIGHGPFGQHRHAVGGSQVQRRRKAGETAANDEYVEMGIHNQA